MTIPEDMPEAPVAAPAPSTALTPYTPEQGVLVKLNPMVEAITLYGGKRVKDMVLTGLSRKQVREIAHERTMEGTRLRTSIASIGKVLKEDALTLQRNVNKAVRDSEQAIDPIESEWRALRDKCDREDQEEKEREQREMEEKVSGRANKLTALGISVQIRFVKNQPWALLYAGTTPLTETDLSVFGESLLWSMTDKAFEDRLENVTAIIDAKVKEQVKAEQELKRLQLDERLRQREAELRAVEVDPATIVGLREIDENLYQQVLMTGRKVITDRQEAVAKQQREQAAELQRQAAALREQQEAMRNTMRAVRLSALRLVNGIEPVDATGIPVDIADMRDFEWDAYLQGQSLIFGQKEEARLREASRAREYEKWVAKVEALGLQVSLYLKPDMIEAAWELGYERAKEDAAARDEQKRLTTLRNQREVQWQSTIGHDLVEQPEDLAAIPDEEFNTLLLNCEIAYHKDVARKQQEERARQERMEPDREALSQYASAIRAIEAPVLATQEGQDMLAEFMGKLSDLCGGLLDQAVVG